jgi:hypothetical protein
MKKTTKQKRSKKSDKAQLAAGAEKIHKAEKELKDGKKTKATKATKPRDVPSFEPVNIPESTRDIKEILADHVTVLPGSVGIKLSDQVPFEESLRVLDWATTLSDHVNFMIGDVLNFSNAKWGEKYTAALNQTGRARTTLWDYASVAKRIPFEKRVAALTFSHHREILRIGNDEKITTVLKEVGAQAEKGKAPTVKELRHKVQKLTPRKVRKARKATSGHGKRKAKPEPPPYEPTDEEQSILDSLEDQLSAVAKDFKQQVTHRDGKERSALQLLLELDNKEKKRWLELLQPLVTAYNVVERCTGY